MKPVHANFKTIKAPPRWLWVALSLVLLLTVVLCLDLARELSALRLRQAERLAAATVVVAAKPPIRSGDPSYAASVREMRAQRQLGWPLALTALENIAVDGVVVRRLEASATEDGIRVEISGPSHARLLEYLVAINSGAGSDSPDLYWTLQRAEADANGQMVRATLIARSNIRSDLGRTGR